MSTSTRHALSTVPGAPLPSSPSPRDGPITLVSEPATSIWLKPSGHLEMFNAPHRLTPPAPLSTFSRARVTISGSWCARRDNAGLLLVFTDARRQQQQQQQYRQQRQDATAAHPPRQYVRLGVEVYREASVEYPHLMVASCEGVSTDWSIHPKHADDSAGDESATVEVRLEKDVVGVSLWCYYLAMDGSGGVRDRHPMRELGWMFEEGWETRVMVQVGVYCAMPAFGPVMEGKTLKVRFSGLQIEWDKEEEEEDD